MYSQCPKCQTIFSVSESDISAYRGLVRCGHCKWIFHALTNEVDGAGTPPDEHAAEETGRTPPAAGDQAEAGYAASPGSADEEVTAGAAPPEDVDHAADELDYGPSIREESETEWPEPGQGARERNERDAALSEPLQQAVAPDRSVEAAADDEAPSQTQPPAEQLSPPRPSMDKPSLEEPREQQGEARAPEEGKPVARQGATQEPREHELPEQEKPQEPVEQEPVEQEPVEQEPVEQEPVEQEPVEEPAATEPSLGEPMETGPEPPDFLEEGPEARPPAEAAEAFEAQPSEAQIPSSEPQSLEQPSSDEELEAGQATGRRTTDREAEEQEDKEQQAKEQEPAPQQPAPEYDFPGEITEEITIEAPPVLWNVFDEETEEKAPPPGVEEVKDRDTRSGTPPRKSGRLTRWGRSGKAPPPAGPDSGIGEQAPRRQLLRSPYRDRDVRMVELPKPRPFKTATLSLVTVLLALLLVWQVRAFYLDELAQVPVLRPYLERLCRPLGCTLPPRQDFAQIDLVGTSIDVNPEIPGALEIKASVINRAHFPQPFPPLRVTLTDREGRIVGRRTYLPNEYRQGDPGLLPIREVRNVSINLAQPAQNAVGYEVELMAPIENEAG